MIRLIPSETSFTFHTHLSRKDILLILNDKVLQKRQFFPYFPAKDWQGDVYHSGFDIRATQGFKTYLPPVFHGEFGKAENGVLVRVKASSPLASFRVALFWAVCATSILVLIYGVPELRAQHHPNTTKLLWFLVIFGIYFGAAALHGSIMYWRSFDQGKKWLLQLLEGQKSSSPSGLVGSASRIGGT